MAISATDVRNAMHELGELRFGSMPVHEAMQQTPHNYFAVFDVDYVPPVDFLRQCMRVFVAEPRTAFVQARFDFLKRCLALPFTDVHESVRSLSASAGSWVAMSTD